MLACALDAAAQPGAANPSWPSRCPLKLGLLIDRSDSMSSRFPEVKEASRNVVDALRDKRSEVTVIGFDAAAQIIRSGVDVSDADRRRELKDDIDRLGTGGETNWSAGLAVALPLNLDVLVLVTDGEPTAPESPLAAARATADRLKGEGTRLVAVGIDLPPGADANLQAITGPVADQDYYASDNSTLLRRLYEIVASSCGVPLADLPKPERGDFPWPETIGGTLAAALLIGGIAFARHRRTAPLARAPKPRAKNEKPSRSMSLDFLDKPTKKDNSP